MSASNQHLRLSPVRACVLLIVVYLAVCAALFAEEKVPARSELSHSFSPPEDIRVRTQRTQRTQRTGDDRVRAFYDSADALNVQQKREEDRMNRYRNSRSVSRYGGHIGHGGFGTQHYMHRN